MKNKEITQDVKERRERKVQKSDVLVCVGRGGGGGGGNETQKR